MSIVDGKTAIVFPLLSMHVEWATASHPSANPLTTTNSSLTILLTIDSSLLIILSSGSTWPIIAIFLFKSFKRDRSPL